jgi:hypothetical protein
VKALWRGKVVCLTDNGCAAALHLSLYCIPIALSVTTAGPPRRFHHIQTHSIALVAYTVWSNQGAPNRNNQ